MDLKALRHFVTVARRKSFVAAADELNLTQPAITRSVRALEQKVGLKLITRHRNGCTLTPAGEVLMHDAEAILLRSETLMHNMQSFASGKQGHFRFGITPLPAALLLPSLLATSMNEQPDLTLAVSLGSIHSLLDQLRGDQIGFFVCAQVRLLPDASLGMTRLFTLPLTWHARKGHPLARERNISLEMLAAYPFAGVRADLSTSNGGAPNTMLDIPLAIACDDYRTLLETVARCDAVCLGSTALLAAHPDLIDLDVAPEITQDSIDIVAVHRRGRGLSPLADILLRRLRHCYLGLG